MTCEVPLTRGYVALVDDEDFERVSQRKWSVTICQGAPRAQHYWREAGRVRGVGLGRFILCPPHGVLVDHIDGDPLNNVRANLRLCTHAENMRNRRKHNGEKAGRNPFKGVFRSGSRFVARISCNRQLHNIGTFGSAEAAARAYDAAALQFHGDFACLNFPADPSSRAA